MAFQAVGQAYARLFEREPNPGKGKAEIHAMRGGMTRAFRFLAVGPLIGMLIGLVFALLGIGPPFSALMLLAAPLIYVWAIAPALLILGIDWVLAGILPSVLRIGFTGIAGAGVSYLMARMMLWGSDSEAVLVAQVGGVSSAICSWLSGSREPRVGPQNASEETGPIRDYRGEV